MEKKDIEKRGESQSWKKAGQVTSEVRDLLLPLELSTSYINHAKRKEQFFVTENGIGVLLFLIFMIVAFGGVFYIRAFLTRRAIFKVIEIFYQHNALGMNGAKTLYELGLERPDFFQRMTKPRDYKQYALQILIKRGIILESEDGRVYLAEERLDQDLRNKRNNLPSQGPLS